MTNTIKALLVVASIGAGLTAGYAIGQSSQSFKAFIASHTK